MLRRIVVGCLLARFGILLLVISLVVFYIMFTMLTVVGYVWCDASWLFTYSRFAGCLHDWFS